MLPVEYGYFSRAYFVPVRILVLNKPDHMTKLTVEHVTSSAFVHSTYCT